MFSLKAKRAVALVAAPIAGFGLMVSMSTLSSVSAAPLSGSNGTGSSVGTVPQCAWHLDGVSADVTLTHGDATKYKGADYALSGSSGSVDSYVAATDAASKPSSPTADDCSWYSTKVGATISVSTGATPKFSSTTFSGDTTMDFALNSSTQKLSASVSPSCVSPWATPATGANDIYTGHVSADVVSLSQSSTSTVSACSYAVTYSVTVPAGLNPAHAGSNYAMNGPSLTTTLATNA